MATSTVTIEKRPTEKQGDEICVHLDKYERATIKFQHEFSSHFLADLKNAFTAIFARLITDVNV